MLSMAISPRGVSMPCYTVVDLLLVCRSWLPCSNWWRSRSLLLGLTGGSAESVAMSIAWPACTG